MRAIDRQWPLSRLQRFLRLRGLIHSATFVLLSHLCKWYISPSASFSSVYYRHSHTLSHSFMVRNCLELFIRSFDINTKNYKYLWEKPDEDVQVLFSRRILSHVGTTPSPYSDPMLHYKTRVSKVFPVSWNKLITSPNLHFEMFIH